MGIYLINPYIFFVQPTISREFFDAGFQGGTTSTTSTTFAARMTLDTIEPTAEDYVTFWQARIYHSVTNSDTRAELFETSFRQQVNIEPQDVLDRISVGGAYYYAGGTNKTFQIRSSAEAGTASIGGYALNGLQLDGTSDVGNVNITAASTTSTTFQTRLTITFPESGDYYVIGSCELLTDNADANLNINGVSYGALGDSMGQDATTYSPYWHVQKYTATAGQTATLRYRSNDGTTMTIRGASLIALKGDKFENVYYFEEPTEQTTTSTSLVTAANSTFTLVNPQNYHLLLGCAMISGSTLTNQTVAELNNLTRGLNYMLPHAREPNAVSEWYPSIVTRIVNFANPEVNLAWQFDSSAAAHTAQIKNMGVALFDLGVLGPEPSFLGSTFVQNSSTLDLPANLEENDLVIVATFSDDTTPATPTGFTAGQSGSTNTVGYNWSYKFMGATPDTQATGLSVGTPIGHIAIAYRNIDTTTPLDVTTPTPSTGTTGMPDCPSITTSSANTIVVAIGYLDDDLTGSETTPPTDFIIIRADDIGAAAAGGTIMAAYQNLSTVSTVDPTAFVGVGTDAWVGVTIALRKDTQ